MIRSSPWPLVMMTMVLAQGCSKAPSTDAQDAGVIALPNVGLAGSAAGEGTTSEGSTTTPPSTSTTTTTSTANTTANPSSTSIASGTSTPHPSPTCGDKPLPDCPLKKWMKENTAGAMAAQDMSAVATAFDAIVNMAPPGYPNWASIARDGAAAARAGNVDGAKAACRGCHDQYKNRYKKELRDRPI